MPGRLTPAQLRAMRGETFPCTCGYTGPQWDGARRCAHCGGLLDAHEDRATGPRFIAPDRHRRELAGFRAWCLLTAKHGRGVFAATPATLDTGTVHGPYRVAAETDPTVVYAGIGDGSHSPYCECVQCGEPEPDR